jgi:hypothetical protein
MSFSSGSDAVDMYTAGRPTDMLWKRYCSASIVLPLPGRPTTRLIAFVGSPPPRTASRLG